MFILLYSAAPVEQDDVVPDSKKAKLETFDASIDGISVQWEWEGDKGVWTAYAEDFNEDVTNAFINGDKEVSMKYSNFKS